MSLKLADPAKTDSVIDSDKGHSVANTDKIGRLETASTQCDMKPQCRYPVGSLCKTVTPKAVKVYQAQRLSDLKLVITCKLKSVQDSQSCCNLEIS